MEKTVSLKDLPALCSEQLKGMGQRQIILMYGTLGVGKTEVVKTFLRLLKGEDASSPSFAMINHYASPARKIAHVDLYRITDVDDLESIGFWDLFAAPKGLIFIEWAERLKREDLPPNWQVVEWHLKFSQKVSQGCELRDIAIVL